MAASQSISRKAAATLRSTHAWLFEPHRSGMRVLLVVACFLANGIQPAFPATSLLHKRAPRFVRNNLEHKRLDLDTFRGKVVLLNFWATWCAPCMVEMPRFVEWQTKYGPSGLQVLGISMDDDEALAHKTNGELRLNYPVVMGDEKLGELYGGILGLPMTYLIDSNGRIRAVYRGETDLGQIETQLRALLSNQ